MPDETGEAYASVAVASMPCDDCTDCASIDAVDGVEVELYDAVDR